MLISLHSMEQSTQCNTKPNSFKIGKYTVEYPSNHPKKKPIHKEVMKQLRKQNSDTLDLSWGKYRRFHWYKVLKHIRESEVQKIIACKILDFIKDGNSDKNILRTLSSISFYNLTHLDLGECHIESIELMPTGPNLNYLSLINNYIYSVKPLTKCFVPGLKVLLLNDNPLKELKVERCNFKLQTYWLERKYNFMTIKECLSSSAIFKLQNDQMKDISVQSTGRIYQELCINKIHAKFPDLERLFFLEPQDLFDSDHEFVTYLTDEDEDGEEAEEVEQTQEQVLPVQIIIENETHQELKLPLRPSKGEEFKGAKIYNWPDLQTKGSRSQPKTGNDSGFMAEDEMQQGYISSEDNQQNEEVSDSDEGQIKNNQGEYKAEKKDDSDSEESSSSCWDSGLQKGRKNNSISNSIEQN